MCPYIAQPCSLPAGSSDNPAWFVTQSHFGGIKFHCFLIKHATKYLVEPEKAPMSTINLLTSMLQYVFTIKSTFYSLLFFSQKQNWDQEKFEQLLADWIIACDWPFDDVEKPEFQYLLKYTHLWLFLWIPHHRTIKKCVMQMGKDTIEGVKKMIEVMSYQVENKILLACIMMLSDGSLIVKSVCPWISVASTSLGHFHIMEISWHHVLRLLSIKRQPIDFWGTGSTYVNTIRIL